MAYETPPADKKTRELHASNAPQLPRLKDLAGFLLMGAAFGIVLTKAEIISWYRIQEMFMFHSFHMYGVIGSAIATGGLITALIKRYNIKTLNGKPITFTPKAPTYKRYILGGTIFGLGWAMTGACPGPLYILIGNGLTVMLPAIGAAILGTLTYGLIRDKLPH